MFLIRYSYIFFFNPTDCTRSLTNWMQLLITYRSYQLPRNPNQKPSPEQCKICSYRGLRCSVLETGRWYPCLYCEELGYDCEGKEQAMIILQKDKQPEQPTVTESRINQKVKSQSEVTSSLIPSGPLFQPVVMQSANLKDVPADLGCREMHTLALRQNTHISSGSVKIECGQSVVTNRMTKTERD